MFVLSGIIRKMKTSVTIERPFSAGEFSKLSVRPFYHGEATATENIQTHHTSSVGEPSKTIFVSTFIFSDLLVGGITGNNSP
jgi:hypothetical protein